MEVLVGKERRIKSFILEMGVRRDFGMARDWCWIFGRMLEIGSLERRIRSWKKEGIGWRGNRGDGFGE